MRIHYPFTLSPLLVYHMNRNEVETLRSALPKDHDVTIPNLLDCTASWLSILTGNPTDADLSPRESERAAVEIKVMGRNIPPGDELPRSR